MPEESKEAVNEYVEDNNQFKIWFDTHYKSVAEIKAIVERQLEQPVIEGETPKWIDVSREPTKEEIKEWRAEHTHSTGDILKKYNAHTGGKMTPQMLLQAITYNEYHITKTGGQKFLKYYEYLEEIESENESE
jgi:CO dehydrogenase/acetyl-CoA synthase beta subunit